MSMSQPNSSDTVTISMGRRRLRLLVVAMSVAAVLFPTGAVLAAHTFTDVPDTNVHHDAITAIADAGVTLGCNPEGTEYCPEDFVRRDAMASFMDRLGALSGQTPSVNAATALEAETVVADAVGTDEVEDRSLRLDDFAVYDEQRAYDPPNVPANSCVLDSFAVSDVLIDDVYYVNPTANVLPVTVTAVSPISDGSIRFMLCNPTNADQNRPSGFWKFLAFRG
jgi:hypothetical protein